MQSAIWSNEPTIRLIFFANLRLLQATEEKLENLKGTYRFVIVILDYDASFWTRGLV